MTETKREPHVNSVSPDTIWMYRQNKPSLIAFDFSNLGIPTETSYRILMARGVFKWFAVRRDLIRLKNQWRDRISWLQEQIREEKRRGDPHRELGRLRGELYAMERCRREVRALCHSERWRAPDHDREAQRWCARRVHQIVYGASDRAPLRQTLIYLIAQSTLELARRTYTHKKKKSTSNTP